MSSPPLVILVVEDEVLIRMDVSDQLIERGHEVMEAGSGEDARDLLLSGQHVDLVFTDVDMPGSPNGVKLAHEVASRWPSTAIIVTSGKGLLDEQVLPEGVPFLPKPYDPAVLHGTIDETVSAKRPRRPARDDPEWGEPR